jgi:hypothetical protein
VEYLVDFVGHGIIERGVCLCLAVAALIVLRR